MASDGGQFAGLPGQDLGRRLDTGYLKAPRLAAPSFHTGLFSTIEESAMRKAALAIALAIGAPLSAHATTTESFAYSNGGAFAVGFASTACNFLQVIINVSRTGTHNLSTLSTTGFASIQVFTFDCTGSFLYEYGSTSNLEFEAPGAAGVLPQSVTASGTVPVICVSANCPTPSDNFTFSMALKPIATATFGQFGTLKSSYPGVQVDEHFDNNFAEATGTVTLSSQNLGAIPISSWSTQISDQKSHFLTISH